MGEHRQAFVDGECVTIGECDDSRWQGCYFACCGSAKHHTTFILHSRTGRIQAIFTRGSERAVWGLWVLAVSH